MACEGCTTGTRAAVREANRRADAADKVNKLLLSQSSSLNHEVNVLRNRLVSRNKLIDHLQVALRRAGMTATSYEAIKRREPSPNMETPKATALTHDREFLLKYESDGEFSIRDIASRVVAFGETLDEAAEDMNGILALMREPDTTAADTDGAK